MKLKSLFLGIVAGASLGMLFAPKAGKDLRDKMKKERDDGGSGLNSLGDSMKESGESLLTYTQKLWEKAEKYFDEKLTEDEGGSPRGGKKGK